MRIAPKVSLNSPVDMSQVAIVLPTYNEKLGLPLFLEQLFLELSSPTLLIIIDDSDPDSAEETKVTCENIVSSTHHQLHYFCRNKKMGRGSAVQFGLNEALNIDGSLTHIVQADTDGSHQPKDIQRIIEFDSTVDIVIGTRYSRGSSIIGWSATRRIMSKVLNRVIPYLLGIKTSDITNGLRRYSIESVKALIENPPQHSGFISLSEELLILKKYRLTTTDLSISFIDRTSGTSSVTPKLLVDSLLGLLHLLILRINQKS